MNPNRFFMPGMGIGPMMSMGPNIGMNSMMRTNAFTDGTGVFTRIFNGIKSFNWSGLLSGANKTLNVVNQTIPLIKQTRPMVNNIRNMVSLAKAFRSETKNTSLNNVKNTYLKRKLDNSFNQKKEVLNNSNYPNFFI